MKKIIVLGFWLAVVCPGAAEQTLREFNWQKLAQSKELLGGEASTLDGRPVLRIRNTNDSALQLQILQIKEPNVSKFVYALVGDIRYEGVQGVGYLEMWNFYPPLKAGMPEGQYFSRTLAESGQMGRITGTCNWRSFVLPFDRTGSTSTPARLELNIFLPARGTVYLGPIKLVEYEGKGVYAIKSKPGAWWTERTAGVIGGCGGALLGILGSVIGALAAKGRARLFVTTTMKIWLIIGVGLAVAGLAAVIMAQPFEVWFVLLLPAVILVGVSTRSLKQYKQKYEELELRKMASLDACER